MKYINMNEVAFDPASVAFPGLGNCHGVVYQTTAGLFGFHIYGADHGTVNSALFFGDFVRRHALGVNARGQRLYGFCPSNRYAGGRVDQKRELQVVAQALGFTGPIEGAMWDISRLGWGTSYVECNLVHGIVEARIEDFSGQPATTGVNPNSFNQKAISVVKQPGFGAQPMLHGSLKVPNSVITGVTRKLNTPSVMVGTTRL